MKLLIIGGYGTFGGRLAELLADEARLTIYIAGRNAQAAEKFCAELKSKAKARLLPLVVDRITCRTILEELRPDLVVDASGPFQVYRDDPYRLVKDCIAVGCNYIDLADGADFVVGISVLDAQAKTAGCFALSGMSSFPVLTAAVVRKLAVGLNSVEKITAGIAPSPFAGVGLNVIRAIASYSGKPVRILKDGIWTEGIGFFDSRVMVVNVPGEVPLRPVRFALTDVPDLRILPLDWPEIKTMWMGAGPTPAALHRLLWLAAGLVKLRILPSLLPFATLMNWVVNTIRWGEHRGGMIVEVESKSQKRSWHLLAEGEGGPLIPSMAAEAIVRNYLAGRKPNIGARSGHRDLELEDYEPLLARHGIKHAVRIGNADDGTSLYHHTLGSAFAKLAPPLQQFHGQKTSVEMAGKARVTRGKSSVAGLVARLFGFPQEGSDIPVHVKIDVSPEREIWTRSFAGKYFRSTQTRGRDHNEGLIVESFGPFNFAMAVPTKDGALNLVLRGWNVFGLPLPRWAMPISIASEHDANGRFNFDVEIKLPWAGSIVKYQGWLVKADG
jgi:Domain of unknown function (DUF4166)/Saccharopine dehydrogenase NADP binding domain